MPAFVYGLTSLQTVGLFNRSVVGSGRFETIFLRPFIGAFRRKQSPAQLEILRTSVS
jgi:hypothetical protein